MERKIPENVKRNYGNMYPYLKSNDSVEKFVFELACCYQFPSIHNPILVSMAECLFEKGYLSNKQIAYALALMNKR